MEISMEAMAIDRWFLPNKRHGDFPYRMGPPQL